MIEFGLRSLNSRPASSRDLGIPQAEHCPASINATPPFNGLLRQYFPKGTDLGVHSADDLDWVAQELNDRPRKRLACKKPIELIGDLLLR
jgi:IS30 family transposase